MVFGYENVWCIVMSYLLVKGGISVSRRFLLAEERNKNENNLRYCGFNTSGIDYV